MAGQFELKVQSTTNPCCISWEDRFLKLQQKVKKTEDARTALKKAVGIYEQQFDKMQEERMKLKKAYEEEKLQTDHERKEKEKESTARVSMENEISTLKAQLVNVETEKKTLMKNLEKLKEMLKGEQSRADEQRKLVDVERKKTEEFVEQLQRLKCEADEAKLMLVSEGLKLKSVNKKFEDEKKKSIKEKKKAEEQQKIAEMGTKHALEEKHNAARLQQQLEDCQNKYNKLKKDMENYETNTKIHGQVKKKTDLDMDNETENKKAVEMYKLEVMKEKARADKLAQDLEDTKKRCKNEHNLVSSKYFTDTVKANSAEMKLLKKRLKLEKARVKHFNQVAELEKKCKQTVEDELYRLKLEFARFSIRVGLCSRYDLCNVGKSCLEKKDNVNSKKKFNVLEKTRDGVLENFKKMFDGDCMKLLDFDSEVEEERYRAAVERPLSPTLPNIEFESKLIDLEDSRPSIESWSIIVFSEIRDSGSISKILHMTKTLNSRFCSFYQSDSAVKNVISTLSADEILSSKEKVCVFFSLFLKSFSSIDLTHLNHVNDGNFLSILNVISVKLKKVMSDVETRTKFAKLCDLEELITLVQDFLIKGEILVCSNDTSSEMLSLPNSKASLHELVIGAVLLASVCEAFDRADFICETSYAICRTTRSLTLTLLHVFAYVCEERLLHHGDYILIMTVIKSLATYCEMESFLSGFPSCAKCPFFTGAVSMEELASLLLKKLSDCLIHMCGMMTYKTSVVPDDTLSDLGNVLSLLELLATKMSWGWVCKNIVSELLKMLEVCVMETPLTSIFVLLGQIARLGIDTNGFQDAEVEGIRVNLISFISQSTTHKVSLPVQFAAVMALLGTTPLSFQEICKNSLKPLPPVSSATATDCIQRWFSLLSDEHKSLSVRLLNTAAS